MAYLEERAANLQAHYDMLLRDQASPSTPKSTSASAIDVYDQPGLGDLLAAVDEESWQSLPKPPAAERPASGGDGFSPDRGLLAVCDPLTALLDPTWPRSLPPPKITIRMVRELFHSGHPATATIPRSAFEGIVSSANSPSFPHVGLVHIMLGCVFRHKVREPPAVELRMLTLPCRPGRRIREGAASRVWRASVLGRSTAALALAHAEGKGELAVLPRTPRILTLSMPQEIFLEEDFAAMSPSHLHQHLAGRHVLIYLNLVDGERLPWLEVMTCARLAYMLAFDRMPLALTPRDDANWGILGRPDDEEEALRRRALWWSVIGADLLVSIIMSAPRAIMIGNATTAMAFPMPHTPQEAAQQYAGLVERHPHFFATHPVSTPPFMGVYAFYTKMLRLFADAAALVLQTPPPYGNSRGFVRPPLARIRYVARLLDD